MGSSIPFAIGACFANPNRPVVVLAGDGGFQMNIQELQTVVRNNLPIKMVVLNNNCLGMLKSFCENNQKDFGGRLHGAVWGYDVPDFEAVGTAYRIESATIRHPHEVEAALARMWKDPTSPFVLNVIIPDTAYIAPRVFFGRALNEMQPEIPGEPLVPAVFKVVGGGSASASEVESEARPIPFPASPFPPLGFVTFRCDEGTILAALEAGYRHLDSAWVYFNSEAIGHAVRKFLASHPNLSRNDLFVTSKVWCTNMQASHVREECVDTLEQLGLKCLDLLLIHWPVAFTRLPSSSGKLEIVPQLDTSGCRALEKVSLEETWRAMEALVDEGLVKAIGVSNFSIAQIDEVRALAKHPIACNQVEVHPFLPQHALVHHHSACGVPVVAHSPLGNLLPLRPVDHPTIQRLADSHKVSCGAVVLRWLLQRGIGSVVKSNTVSHMKDNLFGVAGFQLTDLDMQSINQIGLDPHHRQRMCNPPYTSDGTPYFKSNE